MFIAIPTADIGPSATPLPGQPPSHLGPERPQIAPAVDPASGDVAAARWSTLWVLDGQDLTSLKAIEVITQTNWEMSSRMGPPLVNLHFATTGGRLHGEAGAMGSATGYLYKTFSIDLSAGGEVPPVARPEEPYSCRIMAILPDRVFEHCAYRLGTDWVLKHADGAHRRLLNMPTGPTMWLPGRRTLIMQHGTLAGDLLRLDPDDGSVEAVQHSGFSGLLSAYDASTDALLSFDPGEVHVLSVSEALAPKEMPTVTSPRIAISESGQPYGDSLPPLTDGHPWSDGRLKCVPTPDQAPEAILFCFAKDPWGAEGLYRIEPFRRSIEAITHHLPTWGVSGIAVSPGFAEDRTLFASLDPKAWEVLDTTLWRSTDSGKTWGPSGMYFAVAFSPNFVADRTVYAFGFGNWGRTVPANQVSVSNDAGLSWLPAGRVSDDAATVEQLIALPAEIGGGTVLLALGPTLRQEEQMGQSNWSNHRPALYRSTDSGQTWRSTARGMGRSGNGRNRILSYRQPDGSTALLLTHWVDPSVAEPDVWTTLDRRPTPSPAPTDSPHYLWQPTDLLRSTDLGATWRYVAVEGVECEERSLGVDTNQDLVCRDDAGHIRNIADALSPRATYVVPTATPTATPTP